MKKLLSLALALVLTVALAVPAGAAEAKPDTASKEVGVIVNGKAVEFPANAKPELKSGNTMVPVKLVLQAMGGKVETKDGAFVVTFTEKDDVTPGILSTTIKPGADCYYKSGYTYMPVKRLAAETGYDVMWDSVTRCAVLVDKNALIAEIDKSFTVFNAAMEKMQSDPSENYKSTMTYNIGLNMPAEGSVPAINATIKIKMDMVSSTEAVELKGSVDASSLVPLLGLEEEVKAGTMTAEMAGAVKGAMANLSFQMRFDMKTMTYYMNFPVLALLTDGQVPAETWLKLDLKSVYDMLGMSGMMDQLLGLADSKNTQPTMGTMIYLFCSTMGQSNMNAASLYFRVQEAGKVMSMFLGDAAAKQSGSTTSYRMDKTLLNKLLGDNAADEMFETFAVDLSITGGTMTVNFNIKTVASEGINGEPMTLKGKMTVGALSSSADMTLDMGSAGKATYLLNLTMTPTTAKPVTTPPAGAEIVDLMELLESTMAQPVASTLPAVPAA